MSLAPEIVSEVEASIERLTADSVVGRLFYEIDRIAQPQEVSSEWLTQLLDVIKFSQDIETGFGHAKAYALAIIQQHWEELPLDVRKGYDYQFMTFARLVTGREKSTILNYISTAQLWFIDKMAPEGTISIKVRDSSGRPVVNAATGEVRTKTVDFNPHRVDMTKLLHVNSTARKGEMTPQLWEMLVDDYYSCDDIRAVLSSGKDLEHDEFYYFIEGPGLFVKINGMSYCLTEELNWAGCLDDPMTQEAMGKFLSMLGVSLTTEEDKVYAINHAANDQGYSSG